MSIKPQMMSGQLRWSQIPSFKWNKERVEKVLSALCLIFKSSMGHVYFVGGRGIVHFTGLVYIYSLHIADLTAAPALALTTLRLLQEVPPSSCRGWARAASVTSEQKEGHGKEESKREARNSFLSYPTCRGAHPTAPLPKTPDAAFLSVLETSPGWWPGAGVWLEQTVIFIQTMVFASVLLLVNLYLCPWLKLKMKEEGVAKAPTARSAGRWKTRKLGDQRKKEPWSLKAMGVESGGLITGP